MATFVAPSVIDTPRHRRATDRAMRRLLRIPQFGPAASEDAAHRLFSISIVVSALRCLLTYIILPVLTPILGAATSVGPEIGIPVAVVALVFDVRGIRRFWLADHRWRWYMTGIYTMVIALVVTLLVGDLISIS